MLPTTNFKDKMPKILLDSSITFYVYVPKVDILPFADEIDAITALVNDSSDIDKDNRESSDEEDLNSDSPEFNISTKRKRSNKTRDFFMNKNLFQTRLPPRSNTIFNSTPETEKDETAVVQITKITEQVPVTVMTGTATSDTTTLASLKPPMSPVGTSFFPSLRP